MVKYMALLDQDLVEITPGDRPEWRKGEECRFPMDCNGTAAAVAIVDVPAGQPGHIFSVPAMNTVRYEKGDVVFCFYSGGNLPVATGIDFTIEVTFEYENRN